MFTYVLYFSVTFSYFYQCLCIHELAIFFIKRTPFEFGFCVESSSKFFKSDDCGPIGRPPQYVQNGPQYGAQNTRVGIFLLNCPPFNLDFVQYMIEKISNLSILGQLADPLLGPQTMNWQFFS